jgi:hypothetical protein
VGGGGGEKLGFSVREADTSVISALFKKEGADKYKEDSIIEETRVVPDRIL